MEALAPAVQSEHATCCIVGGGPAGMMLGFLLARAGVDVLVLEKHQDFFRDFRGDTIHPSTLQLLHELGLLEEFLRQPHQELREITAHFGNRVLRLADFSHLSTRCQFIAFMPQWDFLNFLLSHARGLPRFRLRMQAEVTDLIFEQGNIAGVQANTPAGKLQVRANLVVGADGRSSTIRRCAQLNVIDYGAPIDVLWFRLAKKQTDPAQAFGFVAARQFMVLIDRGEYWQCAYIIRKGSFPQVQELGLDDFRGDICRCVGFLADRVDQLARWEDVKLLAVKVDHLKTWWRPGLLCIGDSAHAMSPVGGVGINLAIQDAVATANLLAGPLRAGRLRVRDLRRVQARRSWPARLTQRVQVFLHSHLLQKIFDSERMIRPPMLMRLAERVPVLRRIPARMVGMGVRPEHVR